MLGKIPCSVALHPRIPSQLRELTLSLLLPRESLDAEVVSIPVPTLGLVFPTLGSKHLPEHLPTGLPGGG